MSKKRIISISVIVLVIATFLVIYSNYSISRNTEEKTYSSTNEIKKNRVGLLLGTAKFYKNGGINRYFQYRIDAAVELYKSDKIDFILVSGDNSTRSYNEPITFKNELVKRGIPAEVIFLDYAGFRTLDSVIRAKAVFGLEEVTIISQQFQNERAIFIAEKNGIKAIGYNAKDVEGADGLKVKTREYFARTKAFLDILFRVEPKFYGTKIDIEKPLPTQES